MAAMGLCAMLIGFFAGTSLGPSAVEVGRLTEEAALEVINGDEPSSNEVVPVISELVFYGLLG